MGFAAEIEKLIGAARAFPHGNTDVAPGGDLRTNYQHRLPLLPRVHLPQKNVTAGKRHDRGFMAFDSSVKLQVRLWRLWRLCKDAKDAKDVVFRKTRIFDKAGSKVSPKTFCLCKSFGVFGKTSKTGRALVKMLLKTSKDALKELKRTMKMVKSGILLRR
ncbi:hypothetical protein DFH06DRAFT_1133800 [Mycena polygramma]|nr:hypothetical protein DFH06DRAFT_1133800 [Mycena polygramma]